MRVNATGILPLNSEAGFSDIVTDTVGAHLLHQRAAGGQRAAMSDNQALTVTTDTRQASSTAGLRHSNLGLAVALLVEYALGISVSIYVPVPGRYQGHGFGVAFADAVMKGPVALSIHATIGALLIISGIITLIRAVRARQRFVIATSTLVFLAIIGAAGSGVAFVGTGHDNASLTMGLLTALALLCVVLNLHRLGRDSRP